MNEFDASCKKHMEDVKKWLEQEHPTSDPINHPSHYTRGKIEVLDFIEDQKLGFHAGNVVKYICRAGYKDPAKELEDYKKAEVYLKRKIAELEAGQ